MSISPLPAVAADLAAHRQDLAALDARADAELRASWGMLRELVERQRSRCDPAAVPADFPRIDASEDLRRHRSAFLQDCLRDPLAELEQYGPIRRASAALELHAQTSENWFRLLPEDTLLNGPEAIALAASWGRGVGGYRPVQWRSARLEVPLRTLALRASARSMTARADADGAVLAAMIDAVRQLGRNWTLISAAITARVDPSVSQRQIARTAALADGAWDRVTQRVDQALARRRALNEQVLPLLATDVMRFMLRPRLGPARDAGPTTPTRDWRPLLEQVQTELGLHEALETCEDGVLRVLEEASAAAALESGALIQEVERMAALLPQPGTRATDINPAVEVATAAARLADVDRAVQRHIAELPVRLRVRPTFAGRGERRTVEPGSLVSGSYDAVMRPAVAALFDRIENEQREVASDMVRARDVVVFAARAVHSGDASALVSDEAVANAVALLRHRLSLPAPEPAGAIGTGAVCHGFHDVRLTVFGGRVQHWAHSASRELERGLPRATAALMRAIAARLGRTARTTDRLMRRFMARIGWRPDPTSGVVDVRIRPLLPDAFAADATHADLPALYRHLFRPDPVRDRRFLVGREPELAAIADARGRWESGHSAAVLISGERGSGKTSLINCALDGPLAGLPVARGELTERVLTPADLRAALARIVAAPDPDLLEDHLMAKRQVVVIEEVERTFLRHLGYYEAVRALGRLISATGSGVLWVIVLNRVAFRFLDAATGLGQRFSHRINASTATAEEIRQAILLRHNLSGLRLHFEPPPATTRAQLRRRIDPEQAFFEMTARYSAGVYRTAFGIWLGHIAEIRDGLFSVRAPVAHDLLPVVADLTPADLFSLVAFMQHGSLTADEHAVVFQQRADISRAQLDELIARDIIGVEPGRPGFRVRPEAMSVVQEALYRRNLL